MNTLFQDLTNLLAQNDIRPSYQRIKILEYLHNNHTHPTADDIFHALVPEIPTLSKSTIYNTLDLFINNNLVKLISIEDTEARYDILTNNHGHFKCMSCGEIYNFSIDIDSITIDELDDFLINDKNVYFKGVCPKCKH
ncbi:MAG TPA: transcriptional repressor [Clostridiales bacterium]|jgi:Fe2+ or Zn2+ uptake regulation protein|nr:transcriptional repressor [Clostridiales bacterium]